MHARNRLLYCQCVLCICREYSDLMDFCVKWFWARRQMGNGKVEVLQWRVVRRTRELSNPITISNWWMGWSSPCFVSHWGFFEILNHFSTWLALSPLSKTFHYHFNFRKKSLMTFWKILCNWKKVDFVRSRFNQFGIFNRKRWRQYHETRFFFKFIC